LLLCLAHLLLCPILPVPRSPAHHQLPYPPIPCNQHSSVSVNLRLIVLLLLCTAVIGHLLLGHAHVGGLHSDFGSHVEGFLAAVT
jgi:hypothetical protein